MSKTNPSENFKIEKQFDLYLERVGLRKKDMSLIQLQETKRAFFGGVGQILILLRDDLSLLPDDVGADMLQDMIRQTKIFWLSQK